ncbi:unnamed protein product [Brassicogethes aeneus]|uniref:Fatty acyl-CoA reductase n=1 Tax=Brassicogethes aeneus TaxID=1431903 RepID=A0A9P0AVH4_BRAAE|nr:unnamed protein product [Brassicogethes aeneus]
MNIPEDRISGIYKDKSVLVTGASGFLGKLLIEKILRCCPEVKMIYVLIRKKKGMAAPERLKSIFANPVFDMLRKENPEAFRKCATVTGDVSEVDLGISTYYRKLLSEEVDYIFHCAATTRFDDPLKVSVQINARGTHYMLQLAKQCQKLKLFVHVSTAFAHYREEIVEEKIYEFPTNPLNLLDSLDWTDEEALQRIAADLFPDLPNSYTFSKMFAEALVAKEINNLPIVITRPVVVGNVCYEPYPGWANSLVGPIGLFVAAGKGILRICYMNKDTSCRMFPADITINGMMVKAWDFLENKGHNVANLYIRDEEFRVTWEDVIETGKKIVREKAPFNVMLWYPDGSITANKFYYLINFYLFHLLPAIFVDILLVLMGYKPALFKAQRTIQKAGEMFKFYTFKEWNFQADAIANCKPIMNETERKVYRIDSEGYDMETHLLNSLRAVKKIQLKENEKYEGTMLKVLKGWYYVDRLCKLLFLYFLGLYCYKLFCYIMKV